MASVFVNIDSFNMWIRLIVHLIRPYVFNKVQGIDVTLFNVYIQSNADIDDWFIWYLKTHFGEYYTAQFSRRYFNSEGWPVFYKLTKTGFHIQGINSELTVAN